MRCSGCSTPVLSPDGKFVAYEQRGVRVARVSNGKREATLIADLSAGTDTVDASNPSWQSRYSPH